MAGCPRPVRICSRSFGGSAAPAILGSRPKVARSSPVWSWVTLPTSSQTRWPRSAHRTRCSAAGRTTTDRRRRSVIVVDEYLAIRSLLGVLPEGPSRRAAVRSRPQRTGGCCSGCTLRPAVSSRRRSPRCRRRIARHCGSRIVRCIEVLDPRPRLDEAAQIAARFGKTGWLIAETVTAGLTYGRQLWFGSERNVGIRLSRDRRRIWESLCTSLADASSARSPYVVADGCQPAYRRCRERQTNVNASGSSWMRWRSRPGRFPPS